LSSAAADAILVVHAGFVLFVVGGLPATWIGVAFDRPFAFNPWFRGAHLAAIAFVVAEALLGYVCPLTIWEDALRGARTEQGFIQRWVHAWLFWRAPAWVFTTAYVAFGLLVAATWWKWPPRGRGRS
jgi:polyferredoxin